MPERVIEQETEGKVPYLMVTDTSLGWRSRKMAQKLAYCPVRLLRLGIQEPALPAFSSCSHFHLTVSVPVASAPAAAAAGDAVRNLKQQEATSPLPPLSPCSAADGQMLAGRPQKCDLTVLMLLHYIAGYRKIKERTQQSSSTNE